MDAPRDVLEAELYAALQELHDHQHGETAQASVDHALIMIRIWSLRFQIANLDYDATDEASPKHTARRAMAEASKELETWEKRKSVALADIANDVIIAAAKHEAAQAKLAGELAELE